MIYSQTNVNRQIKHDVTGIHIGRHFNFCCFLGKIGVTCFHRPPAQRFTTLCNVRKLWNKSVALKAKFIFTPCGILVSGDLCSAIAMSVLITFRELV